MDKKLLITLLIIILVIFGIGVLYITSRDQRGKTVVAPTPAIDQATPTPLTDAENEIPGDWVTYTSREIGFSLNHPKEVNVRENEDGETVTFTIFGPSQAEGTEVYDGIILSIEQGIFNEVTLQEFVDTQRNEASQEPAIEKAGQVEQFTRGGKNGYKYEITGLGEFTHYYLIKDTNEYIHITLLLEDPENQGFEDIVNTMFTSLSY